MKKITRRNFLKIAAASSAAAGLAACSSNSSNVNEDGTFNVRVGAQPYYCSVPVQVIIDEGLDQKYGFNMTVVDFSGGGAQAEALGAGEWDIGAIGAGGMTAIGNYNAKLLMDVEAAMDGAWMMARPDSEFADAPALDGFPDVYGTADIVAGKTFLGTIGNISHYMAIDYCSKFGLDLSEVEFLNMDTNNVYTAFVSGQGDIACMGSPTSAMQLEAEGYIRIGGLLQQGLPQQDSIICSEDFYDNNYDQIVTFLAAWLEAATMLNDDADYEYEKVTKFYTDRGRTDFTDSDVQMECDFNEFIDVDNAAANETGAWMTDLIECYVEYEVMDQSVLDAMYTNVLEDAMNEAITAVK